MKNAHKKWSRSEVRTLKELRVKGANDHDIALALGRTPAAIQLKRSKLGLIREHTKRPVLTKGKYTRYMKPKTEVSLLWGLVKYTKG